MGGGSRCGSGAAGSASIDDRGQVIAAEHPPGQILVPSMVDVGPRAQRQPTPPTDDDLFTHLSNPPQGGPQVGVGPLVAHMRPQGGGGDRAIHRLPLQSEQGHKFGRCRPEFLLFSAHVDAEARNEVYAERGGVVVLSLHGPSGRSIHHSTCRLIRCQARYWRTTMMKSGLRDPTYFEPLARAMFATSP